MKFLLVDQISTFEPGRRIVAHKAVTLAEEYLADHFPAFPVLPGVLMVEAMVQAAAWVVRSHLDFRPGLVLLKEARNVTYKSFVTPGQVLTVEAQVVELGADESVFSASGTVDSEPVVKGRLILRHLDLADFGSEFEQAAATLREAQRGQFERLCQAGQDAGPAATATLA